MIPLPPAELLKMWNVLKGLEFESTHGAFVGMEVRDPTVKGRVLGSMKIQVRGMGYKNHETFNESYDCINDVGLTDMF